MKKRIFSLLLALCLVAGMLPTVAYAAGPSGTELTQSTIENYKTSLSGEAVYNLPSGHYYLGEDISVDIMVYIGNRNSAADVTLDLNGHTLRMNNAEYTTLLYLEASESGSATTLTLIDSSSAQTGTVSNKTGFAVAINSDCTLNANGGTVDGLVFLQSFSFEHSAVINNTDSSNVTIFTGGVTCANDSSIIRGGIFNGTVHNGKIEGGIFYGEVNCDRISDSAKVTVTFDSDNGNAVQKEKVLKGQKVSVPTEPTKAGYSFDGWYNGDDTYDFSPPVTENITLTAKWSEKPGISFNTNPQSYTYDGSAQAFSITGTSVTGFDIAYQQNGQIVTNPTDAGSYDVIVTRAEDDTYKAVDVTIYGGLVINPKAVTATISAIPDATYTGSDIEPAVTVYDGQTVIPASEYTVSYSDNKNTGRAMVILTDKTGGNYTVTGSTTFVILPKTVTATISAISDKTYTGSDIEPAVTVYDGETVIPASEYTVSYSDSKNTGRAMVILTDKTGGNYTVTGSTTFEILPKSIEDAVITLNGALTYDGTEQTQNVTVTLAGFDTVTFGVSGNKQTDVNTSGDYTLTVTGNGSFTGSKNLDWNIAPVTPAENPAKKTTARVRKNRTLADASVTNGEIFAVDGTTPLAGTFTWVDSTKVMSADGTEQMIFTPENTNYEPVTIDVAVDVYSSGSNDSSSAFTIKFDTNGGTGIASQTVEKKSKVTSPTNPTKDGYIFDGWYTDKELTEKYDFAASVTKNMTLYAKWVEEEWDNPFNDIYESDWFYEDVSYVYNKGLMNGTGMTTFSPNETTTRGMIVTILYRLDGSPAVSGSCSFDDVDSGAYYEDAAAWAAANGITSGYGNSKFGPNDPITREQLASFLYRYAKYKGLDVSAGEDTNILSYNDALSISEYAVSAMQWLCGEGIMKGSDGNLMPMDNASRAQIAALLHRFCENVMNG